MYIYISKDNIFWMLLKYVEFSLIATHYVLEFLEHLLNKGCPEKESSIGCHDLVPNKVKQNYIFS